MKELNRVHLNGLRALESVGRLGTIQKAADELAVSPGAVSQQVLKTERQLGRPVFHRSGRALVPTETGAVLLARLTAGFRAIDEAVAASRHHDERVLTISVAPVFASKWLVPRLSAYSRLHPDIKVRLDASTTMVDPDISDIDLAIRVGRGDWHGVRADFLLDQEVFPVCTPELAKRLHEPKDVLGVPVVVDANSTIPWDTWLEPLGLRDRDLTIGNSFNDSSLALDAAIAGQGVMLAWQTLAHDAMAAGCLVAPFRERVITGYGYWLVTSATRREEPKVTGFKDWIRREITETARDFDAFGSGIRVSTSQA